MPPKDKMEELKITFEGGTFQMGNDSWVPSDGIQNAGEVTTGTVDSMDPFGDVSAEMGASYSFGELDGQMSFDHEGDLRKKYPALKDAWNHYQNIKQMCETREKEEDGS
mgnify:CR=1 FL=1